jgi:hypothetical protein
MLLLEAASWGKGVVREPRVSGTSTVGSRYQAMTEDTADWEDLSMCYSKLHSVWISDRANDL